MALKLTQEAERDLEEIYVRSALHFGIAQAERYSDGLYACLDLLTSHPSMARERTEISKPVRVHPHGSHLVVYELEGDDVVILRIFHQRSDWQRLS